MLRQDRILERRIGGVEHRPMPPVDAELERFVPLEHKDIVRVGPLAPDPPARLSANTSSKCRSGCPDAAGLSNKAGRKTENGKIRKGHFR